MYLCIQLKEPMNQFQKRLLAFLILSMAHVIAFAQCAMCKGQLESTSESHVGLAVNDGILYLLALPFLMILSVSILVWNQVRKQKRQLAK
jgi:hypothetical protein